MTDLQHPETGEHTRASRATADALIEEGWLEVGGVTPADTAAPKQQATSKKTQPKTEASKPEPKTEETPPLDKMKLTELIAYAETIGVPAETVEPLRKPGASKKQALEIITAHVDNA